MVIDNIPILFSPEITEQKEIIKFLNEKIIQFDELIAKYKMQVTLLDEKIKATITLDVILHLNQKILLVNG